MATGTPFDWVSLGLGGLDKLLESMGVIKSPETQAADKEDSRRAAMRSYLEQNMPAMGEVKPFNEAEYSDVLQPLQQQQQTQKNEYGNKLGLMGLGRSGFAQQAMMDQQAKQDQGMANTITGLARDDKQTQYQQALQKYAVDMDKAKLMAGVQG